MSTVITVNNETDSNITETKIEKENEKTLIHLWMQYLTGILITTIAFIAGTMNGWFSSTLPKLNDGRGPFNLSISQISWMLSIESIGSIFSAYFVGVAMRHWSRKNLLLCYIPFLLLSFIILFFANNAIYLYISKFIYGVIEPIKYPIIFFYLGEIAHKTVRGQIGSIYILSDKLGETISLILSAHFDYKSYLMVLMMFTILSFFCVILIPKSPHYKLMKGDQNAAWKHYKYLNRNVDEFCLKHELDTVHKKLQEEMESKSTFSEFITNPITRKTMIMVLGLNTILLASGEGAIHQYLQLILEESHTNISTNLSAIICCGLQLLGMFISYFLIDRIGRKPLLFISFTGSALSLFTCGLYFFLSKFYSDSVISVTWIPSMAIVSYEFLLSVGSQVSCIQIGELFTINMKDKILVINAIYVGIVNFIINKMFGVISDKVGLYLTFWICCACMIVGCFFTAFILIETRRKTLAEIQENAKNIS